MQILIYMYVLLTSALCKNISCIPFPTVVYFLIPLWCTLYPMGIQICFGLVISSAMFLVRKPHHWILSSCWFCFGYQGTDK